MCGRGITPARFARRGSVLPPESSAVLKDLRCPDDDRIYVGVAVASLQPRDRECLDGLASSLRGQGCATVSWICPGSGAPTMIHELGHAIGIAGQGKHGDFRLQKSKPDLVNRIGQCISGLL
jgi:hypothetical protein